MLEVRRSGFYAWCKRKPSKHSQEDMRLSIAVKAAFKEYGGHYGSPRLAPAVGAGRHRVARLMREQKLRARQRRRFAKTTNSAHSLAIAPNLLARNFTASAPDRAWVTDVTYLPTREGWLYLAIVLDLFSRRVVGWGMSNRNDEELTMSALQLAIDLRRPAAGLLHHSDRGVTYASGGYQGLLAKHHMLCSMSRKGNCWDNAVAESFFSTLEFECSRGEIFASRAEARRLVREYILGFYNPTRLHSTLGYKSPMDFERAAAA